MSDKGARGVCRRVIAIAATAVSVLALTACAPVAGAGQVGVALILKTRTNPYFAAMERVERGDAVAAGAHLTVTAGRRDGDTATQIRAIRAAVARGDRGILITPNGPAVDDALEAARRSGLYVIALDTPPTTPGIVDATFATDNVDAGRSIGAWTAGRLAGRTADVAMLDLFSDQVVSSDVGRDTGFLEGMGITVPDTTRNGSEAASGRYTAGTGGNYRIVGHRATGGSVAGGRAAMAGLLATGRHIDVVYTINEPAAFGAYQALKAAGKQDGVLIVSVDGGCRGVEGVRDGEIAATVQQFPTRMAARAVEAVVTIARGGKTPAPTPGLDFVDTGTVLVTQHPVTGVPSVPAATASHSCWRN